MAKKKATRKRTKAQRRQEALAPKNLGKTTGRLVQHMVSTASKKYADAQICVASQAGELHIGIPLPSLSFEFLVGSNVFPLGRVIQVVGVEGTCKSGFCFELARWFRKMNGIAWLLEHETKFSHSWAQSILGWDDPNALAHVPCDSINDWQERGLYALEEAKKLMTGTKQDPGTGRIWPMLLIIDSIMGKTMLETQKKVDTQGFVGKGWPAEALSITGFMRHLPQKMRGWPFSAVTVNHLKPGTDPTTQAPTRNKAGGRGISFQETWELEISCPQGPAASRLRRVNRSGRRLQVKAFKNSLGDDYRAIPVELWWWHQKLRSKRTGKIALKQKSVWDWHGSTTDWILSLHTKDKSRWQAIREVVDLTKSAGARKVHSKVLGIGKADAVSYDVAGRMIYEDEKIMDQLRALLGIPVNKVFRNDVDFREQIKIVKRAVAKELW